MNWSFNQKCQLIIEPISSNNSHTVEIIIAPNGECVKTNTGEDRWIDRNETLVVDIIVDGLYKHFILHTDSDPDTIDLNSINSASDSIGPWVQSNIFSLCKLRMCTFAYERQSIEEFLSICHKKNCGKKSEQHYVRDLLLIALFVLEHLVQLEKYEEAERILQGLSSCENLCKDTLTKNCCCNAWNT